MTASNQMITSNHKKASNHRVIQVAVIGTGMGSQDQLTMEAWKGIQAADCIIGSVRLLELTASMQKPQYEAVTRQAVQDILQQFDGQQVAILVSGDTGFYSAARNYVNLPDCQIHFYPGISSVSAFCARLQIGWEQVRLLSLHGNHCNLVQEIMRHRYVFCLTGNNVAEMGQRLCAYGLGAVTVHVGENLSTAKEQIFTCTATQLSERCCAPMTVLLFDHPQASDFVPVGIADEQFVRGAVPMTKQEVRALAISQLRLGPSMIGWDIGAGTGSVSVEMALQAWQGRVYAVECQPEAIDLIKANRQRWRTDNLQLIEGTAPEALMDLPAPDAVFIGGSGGKLEAILNVVLQKNPQVRIVATAVTLESIQQLQQLFSQLAIADVTVTQVAVSRAALRGRFHLLQAQNPVFLFSGGGGSHGAHFVGGHR